MKFLLLASIYSAFTATAWAVDLIVPLPGTGSSIADPGAYIRNIFVFSIGLAGLLAMAEIVFGAVQYTISAGNPSQQGDAKDRILNAIYGLLLLLSSFIILYAINPNLVTLKASGIKPLPAPPSPREALSPRAVDLAREEFRQASNRALKALGLPEVAPNAPISRETSEQYQSAIDRVASGEISASAETLSLIIEAQEAELAWNVQSARTINNSIRDLQVFERRGDHEINLSQSVYSSSNAAINEIFQVRTPRIQANLENLRALQTQQQQ